jgi:hypothetical protein
LSETDTHPEIPAVKAPVDPALLQRAVERMRNIARDNGIDPHTILLDRFDGETLNFEARSLFEIKPSVTEKIMPGKETGGEVCASETDLKAKIRQAVEKTTLDRIIVNAATEFLEKRADSGFMADGLTMKLDRLNKILIFYRSCAACHSSGKLNCAQCNATGVTNCPKCRGARTLVCPTCRGRREARLKNGQIGTCPKCHGQAEAPCNYCHRTGKIQCKSCKATGRVPCGKCAASGIVSQMAYVGFEARTKFTYGRETLPFGVPALIDQTGPALAEKKHAGVTILREKEQIYVQDQHRTVENRELDELVVPFDVVLPWGAVGFRVGDQVLNGKLFGLHPRLLNLPPFLETPLLPGIDRLAQAAHHAGKAGVNVAEAIRFRVIGDALVAAATLPTKKAAMAMRRHWPLGLTPETSDRITLLAAQAFANITKMPRLAGLAGGLALGAGLYAAYFAGSLRSIIAAKGVPWTALTAIDALLVAAVGYLAMTLSQMAARRAARSIFDKILPPEKLHKILPRAGRTALFAFGGAVIVFILALAGLFYAGYPLPEWAGWLLQRIPA